MERFLLLACLFFAPVAAQGPPRRTCSQTSFCQRYRDWIGLSVETRGSYHIPASPLCSSSTGTFNATVRPSALGEEGLDEFLLQLRFYEDGTFRFTMDENHAITGFIRTRYVIPSGDVIQDDNMPLAKDLEYTYNQEEKSSTFRIGKSLVVTLMHDDVILTVAVDGQVVQTINSKKRLVIEGTRYEYSNKCPFNLPDRYDAKYIDPACSPGTHDGSCAETYEGYTDAKPHGPSLVGVDVTFTEAYAAYGLQERGTTTSKLKIGGTSDLSLYRFFNLDYYAYPVDGDRAQGAIYGAIPTLTAVQEGPGSTTFTSSLLWVNPSDTLVSLTGCCGEDLITTFVSESGVIDFLLYPGMKPQEFSTAYHRTTGLPALPPLFGLGFHRSRYAVESQQDIYNLAYKYTDKGFPVDVFWLDIEHTNGKEYFTWNKKLFPNPKKMSDDIRAQGKEMVTIVDPHIKATNSYFIYSSGVEEDVFVKEEVFKPPHTTYKIFEANCWPGLSAWPDFTSPRVREWWGLWFKPDGLNDNFYTWNDMNEPSVFDVPEKTMYRNLVHIGLIEHRDVHNLFGPMWTGDSVSQWNNLQAVIPMITALAATGGFSFTGSDIGGFIGNPDAELYTRWFQLSAATNAFFRLHSDIHSPQRDPWFYDETTLNRVKNATLDRYRLLPYWYHAFALYVYCGKPIISPLWYAFLDDPNTYKCNSPGCDSVIDQQVLIGTDIMVRGVVEKGAKSVKVYFPPKTQWYSTTGKLMSSGYVDIQVTMDDIPRFFRAGSIIPRKDTYRSSSKLMYNDYFALYVYLDPSSFSAEGYA
ncbi:hypothetical protein FOZ62_019521 [Perkinsus olseni]|uniref:Neutral alpha-glucosidase AB n=1 Tax=Perkinsus olseni TaxID=32597 RepID=A0A7J6TPP4_PEROL|nr:hypothetical protein FOZ62_019521 [Perkinsus olseni]